MSLLFHILTIFPEYFFSPLSQSMLKKSLEKGIIRVNLIDIRNYATDNHRSVDDEIYGEGAGMLMMAEPIARAIEDNYHALEKKK